MADTEPDGSAMRPREALAHIKAAVRARTISVSVHIEKDHPERGITVAELFESILGSHSVRQQAESTVWEVRGPADPTMAALTRKPHILSHVAIEERTVIITCRRER